MEKENNQKKEDCPLCRVSDDTLEKLKKGKFQEGFFKKRLLKENLLLKLFKIKK